MENLTPFYESDSRQSFCLSYEDLINSDDAFLCLESLAIDSEFRDDLQAM